MTVKLPIASKPHITSECWTCYKFAIMQTSPFYTDWLMSHMELVTYSNGRCIFGYNEYIYPLSYYNEILDISDGNLLNVPPERIVAYLKEQIDRKKYVIIDLNFNRVYSDKVSDLDIHETLIYGYNDENAEFYSLLISARGAEEGRLSFYAIQKAYADAYNYYKNHKPYYHIRRDFFFGITLISLKPSYENSNKKYDFYKKIHRTLGKEIYKQSSGITKELECEYTVGIYRYRYVIKMIKALLKGEHDESETYKTILKIYEYHTLCLLAFEAIVYDNNELLNRYTEYVEKLLIFVQMFLKYRFTHDNNILKRILKDLKHLENEEADLVLACRRAVQSKF